jgi:SAM-dependent methyltransferase
MRGRSREALLAGAGALLGRLFPARRRALGRPDGARGDGLVDRLIQKHLVHQAIQTHDHAALSRQHQAYWRGAAAGYFFGNTRDRFERWFLGAHRPLVEALVTRASEPGIRHLYELGCGAGQALEHLAGRLPRLERLVGVDLNAAQIAENLARPRDPRVDYASGPALEWVLAHAQPGCVLFSNGGVLEYFSPEEVARLYAHAATLAPCLVALVEPIAPGFEPRAAASVVFGAEQSFSHPHPRLLEAAGFVLRLEAVAELEGHRLLMALAERGVSGG